MMEMKLFEIRWRDELKGDVIEVTRLNAEYVEIDAAGHLRVYLDGLSWALAHGTWIKVNRIYADE